MQEKLTPTREVIDFGFDYNAFMRSCHSFSKKISDEKNEQLGYYRVRIINSNSYKYPRQPPVLTVSFFRSNGVDDSWKIFKPITIWRKIGFATPLYKNVIIDLIEEMNKELCDFISGRRKMFDWKKHI